MPDFRPPSVALLALVGLGLVLSAPARGGEATGTVIEVWGRVAGDHSRGPPGRDRRVIVDLAGCKREVRKGRDDQLDAERTYRGVRLATILAQAGPRKGDLLLFRFANGMVVPVPNEAAVLDKLDLFVGLEVKQPNGKWTSQLPPVAKRAEVTLDPRPLAFQGNKVVVKSGYLPGLFDEAGEGFSPWRFVDTLTGIEVASRAAWEAQFTAPTPEKMKPEIADLVRRGRTVYLASCQYCHSNRDVGGSYGWDFVVPLPLHSLKEPKDLYNHVTVAKFDAVERGLMMPTQKDLTERDVAAVWAWNKMLSKLPTLPPYEPPSTPPAPPN